MKTLQKTSTGEAKTGKAKLAKSCFNRNFMVSMYSKMETEELLEREQELIYQTKNAELKPELYQELLGIAREVLNLRKQLA